jgi:predicted RNA methylase
MEDKAFSSIDIVGQCLVDTKRTEAFQKAISATVKGGDEVLELGTGSAILAMFAVKAGAKKVTAIEFDPYIALLAKTNIQANNLESVIDIKIEDARTISFDNKFDVVISEMLTTGVVDEFQVQAINNLYEKNLVTERTKFIPERHDTFVELVNIKDVFFGFKIPMVLHLWRWHNWRSLKMKKMSSMKLVNSLDFKTKFNENFVGNIDFDIKKSGIINGICLTSVSVLSRNIILKDTDALNAPVFIPLHEKHVVKGSNLTLKICYTFGAGFANFKADIV